jgi:hypothetical protein
MLTTAAAYVLYEDADEEHCAVHDYAWMVASNVIGSTDRSWRSFRAGYGAGGEIGKRRYAMSHPLPRRERAAS